MWNVGCGGCGVGCARCWVLKFPSLHAVFGVWSVVVGFVVVLVLLGVRVCAGVWFGWGCCLRIV